MKKNLFLTFFMALFFSFNAWSQCGQVSLIGTINGWADDHMLTRDLNNPELFTTFLTVNAADTNADGNIEVKFRENKDWAVNWGSDTWPTGTAVAGGANIPVEAPGTYYVTFNCTTGAYAFTETCGSIGLIGGFNGWAADYNLTRDAVNMDEWTTTISFAEASEVKFRENGGWAVNWGAADFPSGTGVGNGPNIPVPAGNYKVMFNCSTGAYNFMSTVGEVSMIGEFNGWSADHAMMRNATDPDKFSTIISFTKEQAGPDAIVEAKFRENAGWTVNWGAADFPSGVATNGGANILVPIDTLQLTNDFLVNFEYVQISGTVSEAIYSFTPASGVISMIGAFNNWNGDFPMNRDAVNPNIWTATRSWYADSEVKFRENGDWSANWGNNTFPTGTGTANGPNIPLVAGTYDITFNAATGEYSFVENNSVVGEIGLVGDFTEWGAADPIINDVNLVRDPMYPNYFTLTYNFGSSTGVLFREDMDPLFENIWGGTFPGGTGVQDVNEVIDVPGGLYNITFDANSGDFSFTQLGNSTIAPKVFAMNIDGKTVENDWVIDQPVSKVVDGDATTAADVTFGLTYNDEYLYVGVKVANATQADDVVHFFVDGNKSGGDYDKGDVHFTVAGDGTVAVVTGDVAVTPMGKVVATSGTSYSVEASVKWSELGVTAEEGTQKGFDIIFADGDDYMLSWNGGLENLTSLSLMGDVLLGGLSCGTISLYNSTIGDVVLRNTVDAPTEYMATYNLDAAGGVVFRKDLEGTVTWGDDVFPEGTATLAGPAIPATAGRYTISFNCLSGAYKFTDNPAETASTAYAKYTETAPVIDGDLAEYTLEYGSAIVVAGANPNNTVTWGTRWDEHNLYIGAKVVDSNVDLASAGNPWDNDAIEMYIDGDNSKDAAYSAGSFDTQLIMDVVSNNANGAPGVDLLWIKADGVPVTNFNSKWLTTATGYSVEVRLGWDNFGFAPGKGRTIGFSLGNNDNDAGTGRDYQTVWYGTADNWNKPSDLGDLQLADGPYYFVNIFENHVLSNNSIQLFPNPTQGNVYIQTLSEEFNGEVTVYVVDITGKLVASSVSTVFGANDVIEVNTSNLTKGIYLVNVMGTNGQKAVKKLIVQ